MAIRSTVPLNVAKRGLLALVVSMLVLELGAGPASAAEQGAKA
jgi:hypothetical protein